ncbi:hypothetical protein BU15DRAFT_66319 [Melanogaster broomeanus]|nr:hypothetical protein BU15DRAFT_66319 [Melanogaster broomeanus]
MDSQDFNLKLQYFSDQAQALSTQLKDLETFNLQKLGALNSLQCIHMEVSSMLASASREYVLAFPTPPSFTVSKGRCRQFGLVLFSFLMSVPSELLNSLFIRRSLFFAGYSLLVHDYLLTFFRERFKVEYVWGAPWTVVKATFLLNRYGNLIGQSVVALEETGNLSHGSEEFCTGFGLFSATFMILSTESIHILVLMRAWAIWGCTYCVAVWMILLYVVYVLVVIGMMTYVATAVDLVDFQYLDEIGVCVVPMPPFSPRPIQNPLAVGIARYNPAARHRECSPWSCTVFAGSQGTLDVFILQPCYTFLWETVVRAFSDVDGPHCFAGKCLPQLVYHRMLDPRNMLEAAISFPLLSIVGQRLVLSLRGFQTRQYTTRDLSREVDRQMAAMGSTSFWQAVDPRPNGVHEAGHGA